MASPLRTHPRAYSLGVLFLLACAFALALPMAAVAAPIGPYASDNAPGVGNWVNTDTTVDITAGDPIQTITSIEWSRMGPEGLSSGAEPGATYSYTVSEEGMTSVVYHAVNDLAEMSPPGNAEVWLDKTPPTGYLDPQPGTLSNGPITVSAVVDDALSGVDYVEYYVDGSPAGNTPPVLFDFMHTYFVQATVWDLAGNSYDVPGVWVTTDSESPWAWDNVGGWSTWTQGSYDFSVTADDFGGSGIDNIHVNITHPDGSTGFEAAFSPIWDYTVTATGETVFEYEAVDAAGNRSGWFTAHVFVDNVEPDVSINTAPGPLHNNTIAVTFDATDNESGLDYVYWEVDGGSTDWGYGNNVDISTEGEHLVAVWAYDWVGNWTYAEELVTVDLTKPTAWDDAPSGTWVNHDVTVNIDSDDALSGVWKVDYTRVNPDASIEGGEETPSFSLDFTEEGTSGVEYFATDNAGNVGDTENFSILIDKTDPTLSIGCDPSAVSNGAVETTLLFGDALSGIAGVTYEVDGVPAPYTGPFTLSAEGSYDITATVTDNAGNSVVATEQVVIDVTPPVVFDDAPNMWLDHDATITVTAIDGLSGVDHIEWQRWTLDAGWWSFSSGTTAGDTAAFARNTDGETDVYYRAVDAAGNASDWFGWVYVGVDKADPVVDVQITPSEITSGSIDVAVSWSDNIGLYDAYYTVDGGAPQYDASFSITAPGQHVITAIAEDYSGRRTEVIKNFTIDLDAPTISDDAPAGWVATDVALTLSAIDLHPGVENIEWQRGNPDATMESGTEPADTKTLSITQEGQTTVEYRATDGAGNTSAPKTAQIYIDKTAPSSSISYYHGWNSLSCTVDLSATDLGSGVDNVWYRLDGGEWTPSDGQFEITKSGSTSVEYYAVDNVGNEEVHEFETVYVDGDKPTAYDNAPSGWVNGDYTLSVWADDSPSHVASINWWAWSPAGVLTAGSTAGDSASFDITDEGATLVQYEAVDNSGNYSDFKSAWVYIDKTAPVSDAPSVIPSNGTGWANQPVTVSLSANDDAGVFPCSNVRRTMYRVGMGPWTEYTGEFEVSNPGLTTVQYYAEDWAGNQEPVQSLDVNVDYTAPGASTNADYDPMYVNYNAPIQLWVWDYESGLDHVDWVRYDSSGPVDSGTSTSDYLEWQVSNEGWNDIYYTVYDKAGNGYTSWAGYFRDTVKPTASVDHATGWSRNPVEVTLYGGDDASGLKSLWYREAGDSNWTQYWGSFWIDEQGVTGIEYCAEDYAGNWSDPQLTEVKIDFGAPTLSDDAPSGWQTADVAFTVEAQDDGFGVESISYDRQNPDGSTGSGTVAADTVPFTVTAEGTTTVIYWATDAGGTFSMPNKVTIELDKTTPVSAAVHNPTWSTAPVTVTLNSTDPYSGVASKWYRFGTSGSWMLYEGPFEVTAPGETTVQFYAKDNAGNAETPKTTTVYVDSTAPEVSDNAPSATSATPVSFDVNATDTESGVARIEWRRTEPDSSVTTGTVYADAQTFDVTAEGTTEVEYWAFDHVGNESDHNVATVVLDFTSPVAPSITAVGGPNKIDLTWTMTADIDKVRILRSLAASGFASAPDQAGFTQVYEGTGSSLTDSPLVNGTTYNYTAFYADGLGNWSAPATTSAMPAAQVTLLKASVSSTLTVLNERVVVGGVLTCGGKAIEGRKDVTLWKSFDNGLTWSEDGPAYWDADAGLYKASVYMRTKRKLQLRFDGDDTWGTAVSTPITVWCRAALTIPNMPTATTRNTKFTAYGTLSPKHKAGSVKVRIYCYHWEGGTWVLKQVPLAGVADYGSNSKYSVRTFFPSTGRWRVRAYFADSDHAATWSGYRYVTVR